MIDHTKTTPEKLAEMNDSLIVDNNYLRERLKLIADTFGINPKTLELVEAPALREGEIMKKQYAVACSMTTNAGSNYLHTTTLHINEAESLEEAKGLAIASAMEMKPGFAVAQVVATEIPKHLTLR